MKRYRFFSAIVALALLITLLCPAALADSWDLENQKPFILGCIVNCSEFVSLREYASTGAARITKVPKGAFVRILSNATWKDPSSGKFFINCEFNGQQGYIAIEYLDALIEQDNPLLQTTVPYGTGAVVTANDPTDDIVLRFGPGTSYENCGMLFGGEILEYLGGTDLDKNNRVWYQCRHLGQICWISSQYTKIRQPFTYEIEYPPTPAPQPNPTYAPGLLPECSYYLKGFNWVTTININPDGSFTGEYYHGSAAPESASFSGQFGYIYSINEHTFNMYIVDLKYSSDSNCEALGVALGDECYLFMPGTPKSELPEDAAWFSVSFDDFSQIPDPLSYIVFYDETQGYCFSPTT